MSIVAKTRSRAVARKLVAVAGVVLAISGGGCLFQAAGGEDRRTGIDSVGPIESDKPVRVGQSTRDQALALLGKPSRTSDDGRAVEYEYRPATTYVGFVAPGGPCGLCGVYPFTVRGHESMYLGFDDAGVLTRLSSSRDPHPTDWRQFASSTR